APEAAEPFLARAMRSGRLVARTFLVGNVNKYRWLTWVSPLGGVVPRKHDMVRASLVIGDSAEVVPDSVLKVDLCIVGTGPAGIAIARHFAKSKLDVLVLESGGFDFEQSVNDLNRGKNVGRRYFGLETCRSRFFGGSSNCWQGLCRPLDPDDFLARSWVPHSGWPFDAAHLAPYYRRAARVLRLRGRDFEPEQWSGDKTPLWKFERGRITTGLLKISRLRLGQIYRKQLQSSTSVRTILHASVTKISTNQSGVQELAVKRTLGGGGFRVQARKYVLACGGIENARLLLDSNVGNERDLVGRYFMEHPHIDNEGFLIGSPRLPPIGFYRSHIAKHRQRIWGYFALSPETRRKEKLLSCACFLLQPIEKQNGLEAALANVLRDMDPAPSGKAGASVHFSFGTPSEQAPNPNSRVKLSSERDALGVLKAELDWRLTALDKHSARRTHQLFAEDLALSRLGRFRVTLDESHQLPSQVDGGRHHMGTTRMHDDPKQGVVNADSAVHGVPNLYVAGSSVFPTSGSANPTFTIVALALRLADHLEKTLGG